MVTVRVRRVPLGTRDVTEAYLFAMQDARVQLPLGALGDRLMVGRQPLKLLMKVRPILPEPCETGLSHQNTDPGSSNR